MKRFKLRHSYEAYLVVALVAVVTIGLTALWSALANMNAVA
ncbi:MAG TPA: hypothetical protein VGA44_00835 [Steroidobacteraceae bacterium]